MHPRLYRIARFIVSGATGAALNVGILYVLTDIAGLWYLASAVVAFIVSYTASFFLQKFWTFQDGGREQIHAQAASYLAVALLNLALNTGLLYVFVDFLHIYYLLGQLIASALVAVESYFVYRYIFADQRGTIVE